MTNDNGELLGDGTIGIDDAKRLSGLGRSFLHQLMRRGELAYCKVGKRRLIVKRSLLEMLRRNLVGKT